MFGNPSSKIRKQKIQEVVNLCKSNSLVGIFEAHGSKAAIDMLVKQIKSHVVLSFPCKEKGSYVYGKGGIIILIHKSLVSDHPDDPTFKPRGLCDEIVPGRVVRVTLGSNAISFACVFIHNFGITQVQMSKIEKMAFRDMKDAAEHPHAFAASYMGDFNLPPQGELPHLLASPTPANSNVAPDPTPSTRPFQARWEKMFEGMTEVKFHQNTHFNSFNNSENRIDRVFEIMPKSLTCLLRHSAGTIKDPVFWYNKGLSDHSPVFRSVSLPKSHDCSHSSGDEGSVRLRLKKEWCTHPHYIKRMAEFGPIINKACDDLDEKREVLTSIMRESALQARDIIFLEQPNSNFSQLTRLASISRAVWFQDFKLASIIFEHSDLGKEHLEFEGSAINIKNHLAFEQQLLEAKNTNFNSEKANISHAGIQDSENIPGFDLRNNKRTSKLAAINRKASLWAIKCPRLSLAGVIVTEDMLYNIGGLSSIDAALSGKHGLDKGEYIVTNPDHMIGIIAKYWEPTFAEKDTEDIIGDQLLDEYAEYKEWDWSASKPPTTESVRYYLEHLGNCEPGTDGTPPPAWKNSGPAGEKYIVDLVDSTLAGKPMPKKSQEGLFVFAPKGDATPEEASAHICYKKPKDLRPITLQNEDRKSVAGILNQCILPTIILFCSILQRGFVPGRQLIQNVVDLDFHSRCYAATFHGKTNLSYSTCVNEALKWCLNFLPLTVLFDFAAAFPSVAHKWIRSVLKKIKIPQGMLNAFNVLYANNEGVAKVGNLMKWIFSVKCGVLQGCPLSGTLFVLAIDPLLTLFEHHIHNPGLGAIYACADDIGAAFKDLRGLVKVHRLFELFRRASGLTLKPVKCIGIIVALEATEVNMRAIRDKVTQHIPEWKNLRLAPLGKYLGIYIGPKLGGINWVAPMAKAFVRVEDILAQKPPLDMACSSFNSKALSVLGYVAQLTPPLQV